MTIYLISGLAFDPQEWCKYSVARVYKTREEAENLLQGYMKEARNILSSCFDGDQTQYTEDLHSRNGHPTWYRVDLLCDITDQQQRALYIDTISAGLLQEGQIKLNDNNERDPIQRLRLVDIEVQL